jgi:hypothetical protein
MVGLTPTTAVARIYGDPPREGRSPFAIAAGNRSEARISADEGARIFELYRRANRLWTGKNQPMQMAQREPGMSLAARKQRRAQRAALPLPRGRVGEAPRFASVPDPRQRNDQYRRFRTFGADVERYYQVCRAYGTFSSTGAAGGVNYRTNDLVIHPTGT